MEEKNSPAPKRQGSSAPIFNSSFPQSPRRNNSTKKSFPKWMLVVLILLIALLLTTGEYASYRSLARSHPTPTGPLPTIQHDPTPTIDPEDPEQTEPLPSAPWEEAVNLVSTCQVTMAFQTHSLDVRLTLKDRITSLTTKEPQIDDIFDVIENAEEDCGTIPIATE